MDQAEENKFYQQSFVETLVQYFKMLMLWGNVWDKGCRSAACQCEWDSSRDFPAWGGGYWRDRRRLDNDLV